MYVLDLSVILWKNFIAHFSCLHSSTSKEDSGIDADLVDCNKTEYCHLTFACRGLICWICLVCHGMSFCCISSLYICFCIPVDGRGFFCLFLFCFFIFKNILLDLYSCAV